MMSFIKQRLQAMLMAFAIVFALFVAIQMFIITFKITFALALIAMVTLPMMMLMGMGQRPSPVRH